LAQKEAHLLSISKCAVKLVPIETEKEEYQKRIQAHKELKKALADLESKKVVFAPVSYSLVENSCGVMFKQEAYLEMVEKATSLKKQILTAEGAEAEAKKTFSQLMDTINESHDQCIADADEERNKRCKVINGSSTLEEKHNELKAKHKELKEENKALEEEMETMKQEFGEVISPHNSPCPSGWKEFRSIHVAKTHTSTAKLGWVNLVKGCGGNGKPSQKCASGGNAPISYTGKSAEECAKGRGEGWGLEYTAKTKTCTLYLHGEYNMDGDQGEGTVTCWK